MSVRQKESSTPKEPFVLTTITDEHLLDLDVLCRRLETNLVLGLTKSQVKKSLKESGYNKFRRPKKTLSMDFLAGNTAERRREKFSKSEWKRVFGQQLPGEVTVIRDGVRTNEAAKNIVIGDLIELESNEVVPADMRVVWAKHLLVDNRLITGNLCEQRTHFDTDATEDPILSPNMLFACTRIISGHCLGVALRTGEDTVFGTLKNFAQKVKVRKKHADSTVSILSSSGGSSSGDGSEYRSSSISDIRSSSISDMSCRTLSEGDVNGRFSKKRSGKAIIKKKGSTSSCSVSSSSSEHDSTSEDGSVAGGHYRGMEQGAMRRARSVSDVLEDLGEGEVDVGEGEPCGTDYNTDSCSCTTNSYPF